MLSLKAIHKVSLQVSYPFKFEKVTRWCGFLAR